MFIHHPSKFGKFSLKIGRNHLSNLTTSYPVFYNLTIGALDIKTSFPKHVFEKTFSDCFHFPPLTISRYWHSCFSLLLNLGQMASPKKYQSKASYCKSSAEFALENLSLVEKSPFFWIPQQTFVHWKEIRRDWGLVECVHCPEHSTQHDSNLSS